MRSSLLKVSEVAEELRCDEQTVRALVHRGVLRAVKVGRVLRIPADALDELPRAAVVSQTAAPTEEAPV